MLLLFCPYYPVIACGGLQAGWWCNIEADPDVQKNRPNPASMKIGILDTTKPRASCSSYPARCRRVSAYSAGELAVMKTFEFTLILTGINEVTDDAANALYEAGCDDGSFASRGGVAFVMFDREAASMLDAIQSATADVRQAGFGVLRVETEEAAIVTKFNAELIDALLPQAAPTPIANQPT